MTVSRREAADRVRRLAASLCELKARVRRAVATEAGKAVADAVRDLLTAALGGPPAAGDPYRPRHGYPATRRGWDPEDEDEWADDRDGHRRWTDDPGDDPDPPRPGEVPRWPAVLALTAAAVRGWATCRLPGWAAAAVGLAAGAAAAVGGPLLAAGLALAGAAADLLPHAFPASD